MHVDLHPRFRNNRDGERAAQLISACVHCGFCLATCPTYLDTRDERDSPRGRIYLVKQLLETGDASARTHTHLDRCLTCRSCETTCPSGMRYGALADLGRGLLEDAAPRPAVQRLQRWLLRNALTQPLLFRTLLRAAQWLRPALPAALRVRIPQRRPRAPLPAARNKRQMLLLQGCVQSAATPNTNDALIRVLDRLGIDAVVATGSGCCGAVNYHLGAHQDGLDDMRRNIDAWWPAVAAGAEAVITSASGCGALVADYGELLAADPAYAERAQRISGLARDIGQVLAAEDLAPLQAARTGGVALHLPCSLQHALGADGAVREVLQRMGIALGNTCDDHLCCGSAGTYSILQRPTSLRLRERKLAALTSDKPGLIATANVGCQLHLQEATDLPVRHWIELLDPEASP